MKLEDKIVVLGNYHMGQATCCVGKRIWFVAKEINYLCYIDMDDPIQRVAQVLHEKGDNRSLYSVMKYHKGKIYLIPGMQNNEIAIYDIKTDTVDYIEIPTLEEMGMLPKERFDNIYFANCILWGNKLFLLPSKYPAIVVLDLLTRDIKYDLQIIKEVKKYMTDVKDVLFWTSYDIEGNIAYIPLYGGRAILLYNLETDEKDFILIDEGEITALKKVGNEFWIADRKFNQLKICSQNGKTIKILQDLDCNLKENPYFLTCFIPYKEQLYYIPEKISDVWKLTECGQHIKKLSLHLNKSYIAYGWSCDGEFNCVDGMGKVIIKYNMDNGDVNKTFVKGREIAKKDRNKYVALVEETEGLSLKSFLNIIWNNLLA